MPDPNFALLKIEHACKSLLVVREAPEAPEASEAAEREGEVKFVFKPFDRARLVQLHKSLTDKPELRIETVINYVKFCCVYGVEQYDDFARLYPMSILDDIDGVFARLSEMARSPTAVIERV
jgi:hypothetical protein